MQFIKQKIIMLASGFSTITFNTVRKWSDVYKSKRRKCDPTILYPATLFKNENGKQSFFSMRELPKYCTHDFPWGKKKTHLP